MRAIVSDVYGAYVPRSCEDGPSVHGDDGARSVLLFHGVDVCQGDILYFAYSAKWQILRQALVHSLAVLFR